MTESPALTVRGVRKVYGGSVALAGADLEVGRGEIHALVGENGAGKSTLVRLLAAAEPADAGDFMVNGVRLGSSFTARDVTAAGAAFIHQDLALVPQLSVAENVALTAGFARRYGIIDWRAGAERAREIIAEMGADIDTRRPLATLPVTGQAVVAIARALAQRARLLILDEPTANLPDAEAVKLHAVLRRLRSQGVSSILISHRIDEVLDLADRITVLRDGHVMATLEAAETSKPELVGLMVDHPVTTERTRRAGGTDGGPRLRLQAWRTTSSARWTSTSTAAGSSGSPASRAPATSPSPKPSSGCARSGGGG